MNKVKTIIAGGGMVAGYAAKQMVEQGLKTGDLCILSADTSIPYERPPLSKGFLSGKDKEESTFINPPDFYTKNGIDLRLNTTITRVDPKRNLIKLDSGEELTFEKLILATGARPRTLGIPGASLANVFYLRSLADSKTIHDAMSSARKAVVIGGGFIGMEVAAVLNQKGLEITMLLAEDRIWKRFFTPEMSRFFEDYYTARGLRFVKSAQITELRGDKHVQSVITKQGQSIDCDMIVAGIGVNLNTDFLSDSGIETKDGVIVNEYLETNQPNILAAGDIARYPDLIFNNKRRRAEHWDNAVSQGKHCANAVMGKREPFKHVPYFFSDVFDLSYEFWGDTADSTEVVHRGDLTGNSFSVWWIRDGGLIAAFAMNRPDEERNATPKWIEAKQPVSAKVLADASKPFSDAMQA
jgi:NADPH-dependent 2,4-dienoyl-CoA reductase/sulfur reductase-like enzyme